VSMATVKISIDKATDLETAQQRAYEIADQFYKAGEGVRDYQLEQTTAYPEQEIVTNWSGDVVAKTPITFYVEFVARWLS
jgi:hypothetical protein